ncbi:hypothetical protein ACIRFH_34665 [Streptomyces sp. NPDC093586]|uniref:hypothetical protein n=1 Tax=Streptomyces sp. NPDC093586 TaxID=3366042 RepID=UPI0038127B00
MSAVDFCAHVAARGDVLGATVGTGPEGWEAALGHAFLDVPGGGLLRRDYGLVEINFSPRQLAQPARMACFGFGVPVQRLLYDQSPDTVPPPLTRTYGPFAPRVPFTELHTALQALGHTVELDTDNTSRDMNCYRVSRSAGRIHVIAGPAPCASGAPDPNGHQEGDVWSIDVW